MVTQSLKAMQADNLIKSNFEIYNFHASPVIMMKTVPSGCSQFMSMEVGIIAIWSLGGESPLKVLSIGYSFDSAAVIGDHHGIQHLYATKGTSVISVNIEAIPPYNRALVENR